MHFIKFLNLINFMDFSIKLNIYLMHQMQTINHLTIVYLIIYLPEKSKAYN